MPAKEGWVTRAGHVRNFHFHCQVPELGQLPVGKTKGPVPQLPPLAAATDFCKQAVLLHGMEDGLGIVMNAALSLFRDGFCKGRLFLQSARTMDEIIVFILGYLKEAAQNGYRIFLSVPVDHCIFYPCPNLLPAERRKSCNSSFSILRRLFTHLCSASVFAGLRLCAFGRIDSFSQH